MTGPFIQWSYMNSISFEYSWNIYFEFGSVVKEEMFFKGISYQELCWPVCSAEQNDLCNFGRWHYEEQFYELISNLGLWFSRRCRLIYFLSGGLVALIFSGAEPFMQKWKMASWGTFMWSYIKFGPVVQEDISYLKLWRPFCSAEWNHLCNFERGHHGEHSREAIWNWTSVSLRDVV